ncbi:hypothetical protein [Actinoplanes sp. ATCC 53533]|uniref:hypothetical protein n=1 Tax=Actinoplanes sp. ATCC 53533 TaxID=1288362 RepID=UPI000F768F5F|nr:hypothetical protein [Actinoplanes sp. ATCC 53533]
MTAHIVRALSATTPNITAYRAAFHLPGIESQPGEGAAPIVIANLLANWADGISLFPQDIFPPVNTSSTSGEHRAAVLAAAASGDRRRLQDTLVPVLNLPDQLVSEVTYALASDYSHLVGLCGGLSTVQDVTGIVAGAAASAAERNIVYAASLIVAATDAASAANAHYAVDRISRRPGGGSTLTRMLGVLVRAAWVTVEKASPATALSGADDARLRVNGLAPRAESGRRTVGLIRKAVAGMSTDGAGAEVRLHAAALANLPLPDLIVAVRYAAALIARHVPAAVRTMVGEAADALDPDRQ